MFTRRRQHQVVPVRVVMRGNENGAAHARGVHLAQQPGSFERRLPMGDRARLPRPPGRVGRPDMNLRVGDEHAAGAGHDWLDVAAGDPLEMLGDRRLREEPAHQAAKLLDLGRLAEVDHVGFHALPANQEVVAPLGLDAALQLVRDVALDATEDGLDLGKHRLELGDVLGLDVQYGDFENHDGSCPVYLPLPFFSFAASSFSTSSYWMRAWAMAGQPA